MTLEIIIPLWILLVFVCLAFIRGANMKPTPTFKKNPTVASSGNGDDAADLDYSSHAM